MGRNILKAGSKSSIISNLGVWSFALFLFSGYFKGDPRLAIVQTHIDITVFLFGFSFLLFSYLGLINGFDFIIPKSFMRMSILYIFLLVFLAGGIIQTKTIEYGFDKVIRFLFFTGWAYFGSVLLIRNSISFRQFLWALLFIAIAMSIDALFNYQSVINGGVMKAFGSDHIALGRTCGLGLLTIIAFFLPTEKKLYIKGALWVTAAMMLTALLGSVSIGSIMAFALSILLFFILSIHGFPRIKIDRFISYFFVTTLFASLIISMISLELIPQLAERAQEILTMKDISSTSRLDIYQSAIDIWADSPILDVGTGQFLGEWRGPEMQAYPHNIILELGAETGVFGVFTFLTMIAYAIYKGIVGLNTESGFVRIMIRYLLIACCFTLLNAMVSYDINGNRMLFTYLGLIASLSNLQKIMIDDRDLEHFIS